MMKTLSAAIIAMSFVAMPAFANEVADGCRDYAAATGGDDSGCDCLGEAADADSDLTDALMAISSPEELEAADEYTIEAIRACFPDA